ncbi:MAG: bifunctional transaldolase/phosoglucose isomerase, partial [Pseudomonadota bacterium]|nr:bifunctional transaldolase/phosoglucose isomerase [Pseudomonadota bacterium]
MNLLKKLEAFGQSIWFDYIRRNLLTGGELDRLIDEDGVAGITSNPAIFEKAIAGSNDYAATLKELSRRDGLTTRDAYEFLALADIRDAADHLHPVFEASTRRDGYVSLEVSPRLANDTDGTLQEARRLWQAVDRPNLMIKVPATPAGLPAIETLLTEGINVNVTLLFSIVVYEQVAETFIRALERRLEAGVDPGAVASVASFFISRIDSAVDSVVDERLANGADGGERTGLESLQGEVAIACAKLAYQRFKQLFGDDRWQALADHGARPQRLLWASTGVKNPQYRDVRYIEELIGPDTVNTVPPATLDAFRDHGEPRSSLEQDVAAAGQALETAAALGIPLDAITEQLLDDGVRKFVAAFDKLLAAVETGIAEARKEHSDRFSYSLPDDLAAAVDRTLDDWQQNDKGRRLWARDAWLWTGHDEARWMDWLGVTCEQMESLGDLRRLTQGVEGNYYRHCVLLGMGGSSMAPEVIHAILDRSPGYPELIVLDSTDPVEVKAVEDAIDLEHSLFLVASKSGSTLEPN